MELQELLQRIDALQAEVNALRPLSPDLEGRIMQKFRLDWNFHSSNIEGNSLTFGETKTFLLHGLTAEGKPLRDHLEIKGHNEALHALEDIIRGERPLTEHAIKSFHQIILGEPYQIPARTDEGLPTQRWVTPGKYKSQPNHVRTLTGETFYFASPENTPHEMEQLMRWYDEGISDERLHPLVTAAIFHYRFIRIHPFDDGNGRIARILMNLVLMMRGYPPVIIRTEDKENYYRALRQADGDDIDAFIVYVGEQLVRSQEIYLKGARGEEFDEMDDIDKKIALFKAAIEKGYHTIREKRSAESVRKILERAVIPLFSAALVKLSKFDDLFEEYKMQLELRGSFNELILFAFNLPDKILVVKGDASEIIVRSSEISAIIEFLANCSRSVGLLDSFEDDISILLRYNWNDYRHLPTDPFSIGRVMMVLFYKYQYSVSWHYDAITIGNFSRFYNQVMDEEEIKKISADIVDHLLAELKERTRG